MEAVRRLGSGCCSGPGGRGVDVCLGSLYLMLLCNWAGPFLAHQSLKFLLSSSSHIVFVLPSPSPLPMPEPSHLDLSSTLLPCRMEDLTVRPRGSDINHDDTQSSKFSPAEYAPYLRTSNVLRGCVGHLGVLSLSRSPHPSFSPKSVLLEQRHNHLAFHLGWSRYLFVYSRRRSPTSNMSTSTSRSRLVSPAANPIPLAGAETNATVFYELFPPLVADNQVLAWIDKSLGRRYCRQCFLRRRGMALSKPLLGQLLGCQHSELPIDLQKSHNDGIGP